MCHRGYDYRTTSQEIDVAGELSRIVTDNQPIAIGRIVNVDSSGFNDAQIDIGLAGSEDGFTIGVFMRGRQGLEDSDFGSREFRKRYVFARSHDLSSIHHVILGRTYAVE
jgi:hypothetical protein